MNVYDSSRMEDIMVAGGYEVVDNLLESDVIIMNTCHIREKAAEKVFSELGKIRKYKQKRINEGHYVAVAVTGCVAKAEGEKIFKRMPIVDIVVSGESYQEINKMVDNVFAENQKTINIILNTEEKFKLLPKKRSFKGVSENVAIQSGCDKFCSYCVVPYTRGREYSRPATSILEEIKYIVELGVKEVVLLGQNVDNYQGIDENGVKCGLADLIRKVDDVDGIKRIRYATSYPSQFADDMILAHRELKKLMPFIHLPVQSGSNRILKLMNRKYTKESYIELIEKIRKSIPKAAISSDFIVGFAGETEEDFQETLELIKTVKYASFFAFKYSRRPNTAGYAMPQQVSEEIKRKRLAVLQELLNEQQMNFNSDFIGKELEVLVENISKNNKSAAFGRSIYSQAVILDIPSNVGIGDIVKVRINKANTKTLSGNYLP
jgi:tRNA-2-methylthio-N6-dimethylallyladenosine synthase